MNIYLIGMMRNPTTTKVVSGLLPQYAYFSAIGSWSPDYVCSFCRSHSQIRIPPLVIEWESSAQLIGDFSWDGPFGFIFVVNDQVRSYMAMNDIECNFMPVMNTPPENADMTHIMPHSYNCSRLSWAVPKRSIDLNIEASNVRLILSCAYCDVKKYSFTMNNIVINKPSWNGEKIFTIASNGKSLATFVTDECRCMFEEAGFSNIQFTEAGRII